MDKSYKSDKLDTLNILNLSNSESLNLSTSSESINSKPSEGCLKIRIGPMFCGKTTWLNGELIRKNHHAYKVCKILFSDDVRDVCSNNHSGSTHNPSYKELPDSIDIYRVNKLQEVDAFINKYHVVGIDEGQFFTDLKKYVVKWTEYLGKKLFVVGLDGDSDKNPFGEMLNIIPYADECVKKLSDCELCMNELRNIKFHGSDSGVKAPFTRCLIEKTSQVSIGGADKYVAVCRYHSSLGRMNKF